MTVDPHDAVGNKISPRAGGWDGEGPDHFTELERRLIVNLRTLQARGSRYELRIGRLVDALEGVLLVLEAVVGHLSDKLGVNVTAAEDPDQVREAIEGGWDALRLEHDE